MKPPISTTPEAFVRAATRGLIGWRRQAAATQALRAFKTATATATATNVLARVAETSRTLGEAQSRVADTDRAAVSRLFMARVAAKSKGRADEDEDYEDGNDDDDDDDTDPDDDGDDEDEVDPDEGAAEDEDDEPKKKAKKEKESPPVKKKSSTKAKITDPYLAAVLGTTKPAKVYSAHAKANRKATGGGRVNQHSSSLERFEQASHLPITTLATVAEAEERLTSARLFHKAERR